LHKQLTVRATKHRPGSALINAKVPPASCVTSPFNNILVPSESRPNGLLAESLLEHGQRRSGHPFQSAGVGGSIRSARPRATSASRN